MFCWPWIDQRSKCQFTCSVLKIHFLLICCMHKKYPIWYKMFEKSFVMVALCACVRACRSVAAVARCEMTETCQLSRRQSSLPLSLSVSLIEAEILQSHFQAGNITLSQLVIWYFTKFGSFCLMTNWQRSSLLQGTFGGTTVHTHGGFSSKKQSGCVLSMLGARNSVESRKWLGMYYCVAADSGSSTKWEKKKRPFFVIYSTLLNYCFNMTDEQQNSPLKVRRSCSSVSLPLYTPLMCSVQYSFITVAMAALFQLPERSLWDGKAQLT